MFLIRIIKSLIYSLIRDIKKEIVELENRGFERYSEVRMKVTHVGYLATKVMAIKVDPFDFPCANENPHITVCTFGDGKPVDSNKIEVWDEFPEHFIVYGAFNVIRLNR